MLDKSQAALALLSLDVPFHLCQYPAKTPQPAWLSDDALSFVSVTRTPDELSVVYASQKRVPEDCDGLLEYEGPWRAIKVSGPMDLSMTGVMSELSMPLKRASVPIFALSTWNTDYVLVPCDLTTDAERALIEDGWSFKQTAVVS